jgi:hypothetical protein
MMPITAILVTNGWNQDAMILTVNIALEDRRDQRKKND